MYVSMHTCGNVHVSERWLILFSSCVYKCFACMYVCIPHVCSAPAGQKRALDLQPPGAGVAGDWELPRRCWQPSLGPLQEQLVLGTMTHLSAPPPHHPWPWTMTHLSTCPHRPWLWTMTHLSALPPHHPWLWRVSFINTQESVPIFKECVFFHFLKFL